MTTGLRSFGCLLWVAGSALGTELIDQRHDMPDAYEGSHSIQLVGPIRQEFTPAVGALDFVDVWTEDMGFVTPGSLGATLQLLLLDNATNGQALAGSAQIALPNNWEGVARFSFTNTVWLVPGNVYALEVRVVEGDNWGLISYGDLFPERYAGGRYFLNGRAVASADMWFRTGLRIVGPQLALEHGVGLRWGGVPALSYGVWGSADLENWTELGRLTATTTNCLFTNIVSGQERLFYRVKVNQQW